MNNNKSEESIEKQLDWSKAYHVWRTEGCKLIRDLIVPKKSTDDQKAYYETAKYQRLMEYFFKIKCRKNRR